MMKEKVEHKINLIEDADASGHKVSIARKGLCIRKLLPSNVKQS